MAAVTQVIYTYNPITIRRRVSRKNTPNKVSRILGVCISPDGSSKEQTRRLHQIKSSWSDKVRSGHIKKQDSWYYFQSTVKPLEFLIIATSMNDKQCHHMESPALCSALQTSWIPSNMQRGIVAGTLEFLGIKNSTIYGTQGLKQIMALMNFGKTDSITGKQLRDSLESTKLEVGCSGPLFTNNFTSLSNCITDTWITNTWRFLW